MTRHLGKIASTEQEVVVHYMLIPDQTTHALVTRTNLLTGSLRSEVLSALQGPEGQSAENFADALGRKLFADSRKGLFQVLHEQGLLESVAIDDIVMTPQGNHRIPLRTVLEAIAAIPETTASTERFNPHTYNAESHTGAEALQIAHNLIAQAEMLEMDAHAKREEAFRLAPALRPAQDPAPAEAAAPVGPVEPATSAE
jgi:hypothetical protein